ncbi:hypothetical protein Pcac1_g25091 [Phytophthora cactorum]|nr:hypothetical protein Pcac1_g25091 [Phytophthora cactorum]
MKTLEAAVQPTTDTKKLRERTVSSDNAKPTIVLNLPGVRLAVLTSAYDSLLHLDVTLSSAASLLLATYVACVLAWNILSVVLTLLAHTAAFALISFYTFMGLAMLSMNNATTSTTASVRNYFDHISDLEKRTPATASTSTLPLLSVIPSKSTQADGASASKRKAPAARRRVLAHLNRNRLLVNVVPGDMRRRVDMNLGEANIRVGKAFLQSVPGKRKPRDIYVVRVDCGAQSATQEKHMNPVIMWDVTATFDEFKQLERDLKKELKALKQPRGVKVPHLSSGAVLFVQPELTDHVLNARRARLQTFIDAAAEMRIAGVATASATRRRNFLSIVAALLLYTIKSVAATVTDTEAEQQLQLRRAIQDAGNRETGGLRGLMPILDGTYSNITGDYDYGSHSGDNGYEGSSDGSSVNTAIIGVSIGVGLALITVCFTWKACVECCTSSNRRSRHRAFIERSNAGWKCELCLHINEFSQTGCVLCGTTTEEFKIIRSQREDVSASTQIAPQVEDSMRSASNYLLMSSPRAAWIRGLNTFHSGDLTDRQLVARERHQWKRCIGGQNVRWVNIPFEAVQENEALCSAIIKERDFQDWQKRHPPQVTGSSRMSVSSVLFSDSSGSWLTPGTAFVRDDSRPQSRTVRWRLAEEFTTSSRQYSKTIVRASTLDFSEKAQWFYQYSLKLCSSIVDGYHTIRIHRDRVLKQSMNLFMSAPSGTLHRRLRVDFMDEAGVDGEKFTKQLEVYVFFGKLLGKALLEGLLLNYVTGSSGVPVEGFKGLTGMDSEIQLFTIQLGKNVSTVYTVLPHASTCLNRLDLPLYASKAELERILTMVVEMDVTGFSSR